MKIIDDNRAKNGWITTVIEDRWVMAKVYNAPSMFGVNGCRVSKLALSKTDTRIPRGDFFQQMDYNYARGLDFHNDTLPAETLTKILSVLNALPTT